MDTKIFKEVEQHKPGDICLFCCIEVKHICSTSILNSQLHNNQEKKKKSIQKVRYKSIPHVTIIVPVILKNIIGQIEYMLSNSKATIESHKKKVLKNHLKQNSNKKTH